VAYLFKVFYWALSVAGLAGKVKEEKGETAQSGMPFNSCDGIPIGSIH
jgi:hypothetical protein